MEVFEEFVGVGAGLHGDFLDEVASELIRFCACDADVIVGDGEGAVVIPMALVEDVVADALEQEEREEFALERVQAGEPTVGLFPLSEECRPEFEEWRKSKS